MREHGKGIKVCLSLSFVLVSAIFVHSEISVAAPACAEVFSGIESPEELAKIATDGRQLLVYTVQGQSQYFGPKGFLKHMSDSSVGFHKKILTNWKLISIEARRAELQQNLEAITLREQDVLESKTKRFKDEKQWEISDEEWILFPKPNETIVNAFQTYAGVIRQALRERKLLSLPNDNGLVLPREFIADLSEGHVNQGPVEKIELVSADKVLNQLRRTSQLRIDHVAKTLEELDAIENEFVP